MTKGWSNSRYLSRLEWFWFCNKYPPNKHLNHSGIARVILWLSQASKQRCWFHFSSWYIYIYIMMTHTHTYTHIYIYIYIYIYVCVCVCVCAFVCVIIIVKNEKKSFFFSKHNFVLILQCGWTTWTLTKHIEKNLTGTAQECYELSWKNSGSNTPRNNCCAATHLPSLKPSK